MHVEVKHPLIGHKLTLVRDKTTGVKLFRELIGEITMFLAYEALRGIPTESIEVETPLAVAKGVRVKGEIVLVIDGPSAAEDAAAEQDAEAAARDRAVELKAAGARNKDIARAIAEEFGIARNAAYDISLEA